MRNARQEASDRVGNRWDVRVLEPSPPAVTEPPYLADDPLEGGEILPIERTGARTWAELCADAPGDEALSSWCRDRWLVRGPLSPLPSTYSTTRTALHAIAEHVLAPARFQATAKIGLRFTYHGLGTPYFGGERQVRVEDGLLVNSSGDAAAVTSLGDAVRFVGVDPNAAHGVYVPTTPADLHARLEIDAGAARSVGDWFGFCASILEQLRAEVAPTDTPSRLQLWPEHLDLAIDLGAEGGRANFGGSSGDAEHPEPYLYVGPWQARQGTFWNEPFGASLSYADILAGRDGLAFLRQGKALLCSP